MGNTWLLLIKNTSLTLLFLIIQPEMYDPFENVGRTNPRALRLHLLFPLLGEPSSLLREDETERGSPQKALLFS